MTEKLRRRLGHTRRPSDHSGVAVLFRAQRGLRYQLEPSNQPATAPAAIINTRRMASPLVITSPQKRAPPPPEWEVDSGKPPANAGRLCSGRSGKARTARLRQRHRRASARCLVGLSVRYSHAPIKAVPRVVGCNRSACAADRSACCEAASRQNTRRKPSSLMAAGRLCLRCSA